MNSIAHKTCSNCGTSNPISNRYCTICGYELPKNGIEKISEAFNNSNSKLKHYNFEYTDRRLLIKLLLITYALFFALLFWFIYQYHVRTVYPLFIAAVLVTVFILWLNRKRIKQSGTASIHETSVDFNLKNSNQNIPFGNIQSYKFQVYQGFMIKLVLTDGRQVIIFASTYFCKPEQFGIFCDDLVKALVQAQVAKEKSFFEKKGIFLLLVSMSVLIVALIILELVIIKKMRNIIFISAFAIATLWIGYYRTKQRKTNKNK